MRPLRPVATKVRSGNQSVGVKMDMQTAKNELITAVMSNSGALQKALILLQGKDDEVTSALTEILQASETYVFARINVR